MHPLAHRTFEPRRRGRRVSLAVILVAAALACSPQEIETTLPSTAPTTTVAPRSGARIERPPCRPARVISRMPIRQRLAQLLMVGAETEEAAAAAVRDFQVGGIFVHGSDDSILSDGALSRVRALAAPIPLMVSTDEEGGRVQRLDNRFGSIASARVMAATMSTEAVRLLAFLRGRQLRSVGITTDLGPVVDVSSQADDDVIGDRSFADDPQVVTRYARAFIRGLREGGVSAVLKHFPGHGRATGDSHIGVAVTPSIEDLRAIDLEPYRALLAEPGVAVMIGHLDVPGVTPPGVPATVSPELIEGILRNELAFDGLVMTDDLISMNAITDRFDLPQAVVAAIGAGIDLALWVTTDRLGEVMTHLQAAVEGGELSERRVNDAVRHVLIAKAVDPCELPT